VIVANDPTGKPPLGKPPLLGSREIDGKLEIQGFTPIQGDLASLLATLPKGAPVWVPGAFSRVPIWGHVASLPDTLTKGINLRVPNLPFDSFGAPIPAPQAPAIPPMIPAEPASNPPTKPPPTTGYTRPSWSVAEGWKAGAFSRSVASKGVGVMLLTQHTTQAQVVDTLTLAGFHPDTADIMANAALTYAHSHAFNALLVGFTVAGTVGTIDGFIRPTKKRRYDRYVLAGVLASFLYYFLVSPPNPFVGTWTLDATQSRYEFGDPPQQASYKIEQKRNLLEVSEDSVLSDRKPAHIRYQLELDGKDHPAPDMPDEDTIAATLTKNTFETVLKKNGRVVSRETRVLSADQKLMTVTLVGITPTKQQFKNVAVYERK